MRVVDIRGKEHEVVLIEIRPGTEATSNHSLSDRARGRGLTTACYETSAHVRILLRLRACAMQRVRRVRTRRATPREQTIRTLRAHTNGEDLEQQERVLYCITSCTRPCLSAGELYEYLGLKGHTFVATLSPYRKETKK